LPVRAAANLWHGWHEGRFGVASPSGDSPSLIPGVRGRAGARGQLFDGVAIVVVVGGEVLAEVVEVY
jgi:hypothetical protein